MDTYFKTLLEANQVYIAQGIEKSIPRELKAARNDLTAAWRSMGVGDYKWSTAQAYQAMFYVGRALLYLEGYKARTRQSISPALESLFVETGRLPSSSIKYLIKTKDLQDAAFNNLEYSKDTAESILSWAERFMKEAGTLLNS